jgi:hypothetical protein
MPSASSSSTCASRFSAWSLFFVKAALAVIPAAIIVGFLIMLVTALVAALVGDSGFVMMRRWSF